MARPLDVTTTKVLITGGSEGIGFGLAKRFSNAGAQVMITGRSAEKLSAAKARLPGLLTVVSDAGSAADREALAQAVKERMPGLNVVINNAGIQRRIGLAADNAPWPERQAEIDILLAGPIHLDHLLLPMMLADNRASVIANVSSGGAFVPQVFAPVYSACKAAIHSYTMVLRQALSATDCRVVEIVPPAVQTALGGAAPHGASLDEFCNSTFVRLCAGETDLIGFGPTDTPEFLRALKPYAAMFEQSAVRYPDHAYPGRK